MELPLHNTSGASSTITVSDRLFATPANADLIFQIATSQMSNKRQVVAHTKTRSEVAGGGKKPWRQKGTGRARHGSIRSPIWVGGGVAHGPTKEVNFKKTITKAAARRALAGVLSARVAEGHLAVVEQFAVTSGKTKDAIMQMQDAVKVFKGYRAGQRVLLVLAGSTDEIATRRAVANLPYVQAVRASDLNALTVLSFPYVVATAGAIEAAQKTFSQ